MDIPNALKEFSKHILFTNAWERIKQIKSLLGGTKMPEENLYERAILAPVFPGHRATVRNRFYDEAFKTGKEVLYVSIMSRDTLGDSMRNNLKRATAAGTRLRVLTWDPKVGAKVVETFRKHLGEFERDHSGALRQVETARDEWTAMAKEYSSAIEEVRVYDSVPTLQGIVVMGEWALIELLPYRTKKESRPAIFVSASIDKELYCLFESQFSLLWRHSKPVKVRFV